MHRHRIFFLLFIPFLLGFASCGSEEQNHATQEAAEAKEPESLEEVQEEHQRRAGIPGQDTMHFGTAFALFLKALHTSDTTTLNEFIHPDYGVWIIEQPGAVPKMTFVTDIRKFKREFQGRSFFTLGKEVKECNLLAEPWPTFDCADMNYEKGHSGYSKDGCFVWQPDKFRQSGYWDYASLSDLDKKRVKASLPYLQKSVLHTPTSFEFHFGYLEGHWRLLFAKLIYPCSA